MEESLGVGLSFNNICFVIAIRHIKEISHVLSGEKASAQFVNLTESNAREPTLAFPCLLQERATTRGRYDSFFLAHFDAPCATFPADMLHKHFQQVEYAR
jgi:hypothetical protein